MPGMPRPDSEATDIAMRILGRKIPFSDPEEVPPLVGPKMPPKAFDGMLG